MATHAYPFTAFSFAVEIVRSDAGSPLVAAAFAECDGLEMSMEVKTIREGGANDRQVRLAGPATVGQLTLKRGMTADSLPRFHRLAEQTTANMPEQVQRALVDRADPPFAVKRQQPFAEQADGFGLQMKTQQPLVIEATQKIAALDHLR